MFYLLDSDVLIQAKNTYYAFDICPGFWEFLERERDNGEIRSIRQVRGELEAGNDDLAAWARLQGNRFFLDPTPGLTRAMQQVSQWVMTEPFTEAAKREFLARADTFLVAHALAEDDTVVTNEVPNQPGQFGKVKIPTACDAVGVPHDRLLNVLRRRGAMFDLRPLGA